MKIIRQIGSLAFVLGLFTAVFAGIPWYVIVEDDHPGGKNGGRCHNQCPLYDYQCCG